MFKINLQEDDSFSDTEDEQNIETSTKSLNYPEIKL